MDLHWTGVIGRAPFAATVPFLRMLPGDVVLLGTGLSIELPPGYEAQVRPRSGLSRFGVLAAFGTVDCDYRGEIGVVLSNVTDHDYMVNMGERIAQLAIVPITQYQIDEVEELSETERGACGFGSTGR
jgi:dUTP pyrophosphatase